MSSRGGLGAVSVTQYELLPQQQQHQQPPLSPTTSEFNAPGGGSALLSTASLGPLQNKTHLFLTTKRKVYDSRAVVVRSVRFVLRVLEFLVGFVSLIMLYVATFNVNFTSSSIGLSGINVTNFTAMTSSVVALSHIIAMLFPQLCNIPPSRQNSVSVVELGFDVLYGTGWLYSCVIQAARGSCPRSLFRIQGTPESALNGDTKLAGTCLPWNLCWGFGIAATVFYYLSALQYFRARKKKN
ncbi:hypothetical protein RI367_004116 [Sorochytrium milnesiophthora]